MNSLVVEVLLAPVVTAALGALGLVLRERRIRRDVENRRARALADATAQAAFVEQWWRALREVNGPQAAMPDDAARARAMLAEAAGTVSRSSAPETTPDGRPGLLRRLLLLYRLHSPGAQFVRLAYYFWIASTLASYVFALTEEVPGESRLETASYATTVLIMYLFPTAALRALAVYLDTRKLRRPAATPQ